MQKLLIGMTCDLSEKLMLSQKCAFDGTHTNVWPILSVIAMMSVVEVQSNSLESTLHAGGLQNVCVLSWNDRRTAPCIPQTCLQ